MKFVQNFARMFSGHSSSSLIRTRSKLNRAIRPITEELERRQMLDDGPFFEGSYLDLEKHITTAGNEGWNYTVNYGDNSDPEEHVGWDGGPSDYTDSADLSLHHLYNDNATLTVTDHWTADWNTNGGDDIVVSQDILNVQPTSAIQWEVSGTNFTIDMQDEVDPSSADATAGFHYSYADTEAGLADTYEDASDGPQDTITSGTGVVLVRMFDKDGGRSDYSTQNVRPTLNFPSAATAANVFIDWVDVDGDQTSWRIRRSGDGGVTFPILTSVSGNITQYTDPSVEPGHTYIYEMRGMGEGDGDTAYSFKWSVAVPALPAPTGITTSVAADHTITVNWSLPGGVSTALYQGFRIDVYDPDETITSESVPLTSYIAQGSARSQDFDDLDQTGAYQFVVTGLTHATFNASGMATDSSGSGSSSSALTSDPESSGWHWVNIDNGDTIIDGVSEDPIDSEDLPEGWDGIVISNLPLHSRIWVRAHLQLAVDNDANAPLNATLDMQLDGHGMVSDGLINGGLDGFYLEGVTEQGDKEYFRHSSSTATLTWKADHLEAVGGIWVGTWYVDWSNLEVRAFVPSGPLLPADDVAPSPPPPPGLPTPTVPGSTTGTGTGNGLLEAFDGTWDWRGGRKTIIQNFSDHYGTPNNDYYAGVGNSKDYPNDLIHLGQGVFGFEARSIVEKSYKKVVNFYQDADHRQNEPLDVIGLSRGAFQAVALLDLVAGGIPDLSSAYTDNYGFTTYEHYFDAPTIRFVGLVSPVGQMGLDPLLSFLTLGRVRLHFGWGTTVTSDAQHFVQLLDDQPNDVSYPQTTMSYSGADYQVQPFHDSHPAIGVDGAALLYLVQQATSDGVPFTI